MYLDKSRVRKLMDNSADGSYNKFARMLDVDVGQLHKILNSDSNAGPKFLGKLMAFCQDRNINFIDLITTVPTIQSDEAHRVKR
ncbi:hypothetical protein AM500_21545 [Bacillus sp. FJAT-18017]|nr:hypothetical protein AM500_21545 [Bacillus sp. FJAT-18017]